MGGILDARNIGDLVAENNRNGSRHTHSLASLFNVAKDTPATGMFLYFDGSTKVWTPKALANADLAAVTLDALSDVVITTPATTQHLRYDGANWVNFAPLLDDNSDVVLTSPAVNHVLKHNGTNWVNASGAWTAFTPTITGWAIGDGTLDCAYQKDGRKVTVRYHVVAGSTTTFAAALSVTAPFTIATEMWGMFGMANDSSAAVFAPIMVRAQAASTVTFYPLTGVTQMNNAGLQTTAPWAWAVSDRVHCTFTYEATT